MTREEAIQVLESMKSEESYNALIDLCNIAIEALSTEAEPPVLTCDGCRHVGTYDTDFPCSGCIRREKDYYEQER